MDVLSSVVIDFASPLS
uniref:Uncharacterized protein n=1 Tax=Anguilla anguilla TaxID=7936 RepID=A0A0E9XIB8_ANGAN